MVNFLTVEESPQCAAGSFKGGIMKTRLLSLLLILTVVFLSNAFASDRLSIAATSFKPVERSYGHVTGQWKVTLKNNTEEEVCVSVTINYLDKDKTKLDFSFEDTTLQPNETKTISDTKMFTEEVWNKIENYATKVEER
jgi:predicted metalloprotease